jgi:hypothetical protein
LPVFSEPPPRGGCEKTGRMPKPIKIPEKPRLSGVKKVKNCHSCALTKQGMTH